MSWLILPWILGKDSLSVVERESTFPTHHLVPPILPFRISQKHWVMESVLVGTTIAVVSLPLISISVPYPVGLPLPMTCIWLWRQRGLLRIPTWAPLA